jgi:hypothetical protein
MRRLITFGVTCVAVLAATPGIVGSALAAPPLPSVLPGENSWTGKSSGEVLFSTVGGQILKCTGATIAGKLELPTKTLGEFHITFEKCEEPNTKVACTGSGDEAGTILMLGTWHSVVDVDAPELHSAVLFLVNEIINKCSALIEFKGQAKGMLLCLVKEPLSSKPGHEFLCKTIKKEGKDTGKPEETKYINDKEEVSISPLLVSVNGGAFQEYSIEMTGTMVFGAAQAIDD